jgi:hypothetical protein
MLRDEHSGPQPSKQVTRNGAPPPAPKGNLYAAGNKGAHKDFLTKTLISQLHEVVKRDVPRKEIYLYKGKPKTRWIISKESHERIHFLVEALLENAMNGETDAIKYVFDRIEGRPMSIMPDDGSGQGVTINFLQVDQRI